MAANASVASNGTGSGAVEIEASDVLKTVLQFCKENGLHRTFQTLQDECQVHLNTVDSLETFVGDVHSGRWDAVLPQVAQLKLHRSKLETLYEQIVMELAELREIDTARSLMKQTQVMINMKLENPARYQKLEHLLSRNFFEAKEVYGNEGRDKRRARIARDLAAEVAVVPPARLMTLIGQALKWQKHTGQLPPGTKFDVFRGRAPTAAPAETDVYPTKLEHVIRYGKGNHAEAARFSPDGSAIATGAVDGFIEILDPSTGKLKTDLTFQAEERFMMHEAAVLSLAFSRDSELLASGSQDGAVKVWRLLSGQCLRRILKAHSSAVACVEFTKESSQLLSGSLDGSLTLHGLKSGRALREFKGHTSYINAAIFSKDGSRVVSGSADGKVKIWDSKSAECLVTFEPPRTTTGTEGYAITAISLFHKKEDLVVVCDRSSTAYLVNLKGQVLTSYSSGKEVGGEFIACALSAQCQYLYTVGQDHNLYCFDTSSGKLEHLMEVHEKDVVGIVHHPHRNVLATYGTDGTLKLWVST